MKFDYSKTIQGISLKDIRKLFRRTEHVNVDLFKERFSISHHVASYALDELLLNGLLEKDEYDAGWFKTTSLGKSLAASATVRMTNKKAHELYNSFLKRVEYVNSDESGFAYGVDRVVLLGSFLNPNLADYGDIDLLVRLVKKYPADSETQKQLEEESRAFGSYPSGFIHWLSWPSREVIKYLKNSSRYMSIDEDTESLEMIEPKGAYKIVYEYPIFPLKPK
jgi:predicted nucleotidyltransferase